MRFEQLAAAGATTIGTACPFCLIMIEDAVKDAGKVEEVTVLDVAEMIARSLGDPGN
jgi:Fe-S oxidoreductase